MSVIIGYKKDNKIWMAGDSRISMNTHVEKLTDSTSKIWQENNQLIIGGVGYLHELQFMRYNHFISEEDLVLNKVNHEYLYFLYSVYGQEFIKHFGIELECGRGYSSVLNSSFMFAANNHLMVLDSMGAVTEYEDFAAIGCASDLVSGYILGHKDTEPDVEKLLTDAIKYAAQMDNGIDTNIHIYCLETTF